MEVEEKVVVANIVDVGDVAEADVTETVEEAETTIVEQQTQPTQIVVLQSTPSNLPRLTPTGKISHAKTRVYTQRYRKDWEQMPDFRGWLTEVPHQPTRAYCLYCKKNLHAHRLSLLKHMCTMKHQRSALVYSNEVKLAKRLNNEETPEHYKEESYKDDSYKDESYQELHGYENLEDGQVEHMEGMEYVVHRLDLEDEEQYEIKQFNEESVEQAVEYIDDESNHHESKAKRIKLEKDMRISDVHTEYLQESHEGVELEMVVEPEEDNTITYTSANDQTILVNDDDDDHSDGENKDEAPISLTDEDFSEYSESEDLEKDDVKPIHEKVDKSANDQASSKKMVVITSSGKAIAFDGPANMKSNIQYVLSKIGNKPSGQVVQKSFSNPIPILPKPSGAFDAGTSHENPPKTTLKRTAPKKPTITTHVLDTSKGISVSGLQVSLYKLMDGRWTFINESTTSASGQCNDLVPNNKKSLTNGRYKLHFDVDKYFTLRRIETIYPFIEIVFDIKNATGNYHIPLLLSPFGYTTYRGSER